MEFTITDRSMGNNAIIFGADMSSSVHFDNKSKDILVLDEGPIQGFYDITLTAEAKYPINSTSLGKTLYTKSLQKSTL